MKVALIGMGASAFGSFLALEEFGQKIESIDIFTKKRSSIKRKYIYKNSRINDFYRSLKSKSLIPPKINIQSGDSDTDEIFRERFEAMNLWGASLLPYSKKALSKNRLSYDEFMVAYTNIGKHLSISGDKKDQIEKLFKLTYINENKITIDHNISGLVKLLSLHNNDFKIFSGVARVALKHTFKKSVKNSVGRICQCSTNNCQFHDIFLEPDIEKHFLKSDLRTKIFYTEVEKVDLDQASLSYIDKKTLKLNKTQYDLIFICTGPKETIKLIQRSTKINNFNISDSKSYLFPIFATNFNIFRKNIESFSLTNAISVIESIENNEQYFVQIYKVSEDLWKAFLPFVFWPLISFFRNFIYFGVLYLDNQDRVDYEVNFTEDALDVNKVSKDSKKKVRLILSTLSGLLKKQFLMFSNLYFEKRTSHHFGRLLVNGSYLQDWHTKYNSPKIVFNGANNFKKLPSSSPTFTVMAEGYVNVKKLIASRESG